MKGEVFLNNCDPRFALSPNQILAHINLHALFFKESVIQDNFLISKKLFEADKRASKNHFANLISSGILNVAIRHSSEYSIVNLKEKLFNRAVNDKSYIPFEDKDFEEFYIQNEFNSFLSNIDAGISNTPPMRTWSEQDLGRNLRDLMIKSAEELRAGIELQKAKKIIADIEQEMHKNKGNGHSRSMYYNYINELRNPLLKKQIKKWVDLNYTKNLSSYLSLETSLSRKVLSSDFGYNPGIFKNPPYDFNQLPEKINATIFNPKFLLNLDVKSIETIREFDEFKNLQGAYNSNNTNMTRYCLSRYLARLSDEAPKFCSPYKEEIEELNKKANLTLVDIANGITIILSHPQSQAIPNADWLNFITEIFTFILGKREKGLNKKLEKISKKAEEDLLRSRFLSEVENSIDIFPDLEVE